MGLKSFTSLQIALKSISQVVLPDTYVRGSKSDQDQSVYVNDYAVQSTFASGDSPTPAEVLTEEITLDGTGSYDIDLTAAKIVGAVDVSGDPAASEDLTAKKLCYLELHSGSSNAGDITVKPGSSNGYTLFGSAITQGVKVPPYSHLALLVQASGLAAISATVKVINVSGTTGDTLNLIAVFE